MTTIPPQLQSYRSLAVSVGQIPPGASCLGGRRGESVGLLCHPDGMSGVSLLDRLITLYSEVDRRLGLRPGTARRGSTATNKLGRHPSGVLRPTYLPITSLTEPSRAVMERASLAIDARGQRFAADLIPDEQFPGIVVSPERLNGQPTFVGRRVAVATIAGMVAAGEAADNLAADYGLSLSQVHAAARYAAAHGLPASFIATRPGLDHAPSAR